LYLTNFTGSSAIVVLTPDRLWFVTDFRYVTVVESAKGTEREIKDLALVRVDGSYDVTLATLLGSIDAARIGFESAHLTVNRHAWLLEALAAHERQVPQELIPAEGIVERARLVEGAHELATLREAARRLSVVTGGVFSEIRAGRTEVDVALAIDWRIRQAGFSRTAFETIVATGPNGALPHAHPGERTLSEGDLVVL